MMHRYRRQIVRLAAAVVMLLTLLAGGLANAEAPVSSDLKAEVTHLALVRNDQTLLVALGVQVVNNGKAPSAAFEIPIPAAADNFEPMEGNVTRDGDKVVVPGGTPAGGTAGLGFRYTLPAGVFQVPFPDIPPAGMSLLLLDESSLTLVSPTGAGVSDEGVVALGDTAYRQFVVTRPAAGMSLTIEVKPGGDPTGASKAIADAKQSAPAAKPAASQSSTPLLNRTFHGGNANVMLWQRMTGSSGHGGLPGILLIGLFLVAIVAGLVTLFRRHARAATQAHAGADRGGESELVSLRRQKTELARHIAELDSKAAGAPSAGLARQRAEAKQQLVQVILRLKRLEPQSE